MKPHFFFLAVLLTILFGCAKETPVVQQDTAKTSADFETNLKSDMDYKTIVSTFGQPTKDIGSGIHIYVYVLSDATEIWIGYVDKILYARHMDKNQQLIKVLI